MAQCSIARIAAVTFAAWLLLLIYISSVLVKEQQKDSVQRKCGKIHLIHYHHFVYR